jgi:cation:H+ antiporter
MDLVLTVIGLAALVGAGDSLVRGAVALSLRLGVPALIVSLTVVAFGTSAPELLVGIEAALSGADGIAFGNVVGSNIANVLLVLGIPALISRIDPDESDSRADWLMMMAASAFFIGLCFTGGLDWRHGVLLVAGLVVMLADAYRRAMAHRRRNHIKAEEDLIELEDADPHMPVWKIATLIGVGVIGLPLGAHFLIDGARGIASAAGVSEAAIGLTLVAVGTSLPELVTTIMAALRRQAEVAIGNVIGSNLFNLLGIMGVVACVHRIEVPPELLRLDLWAMLATSALLYPFVFMRRGIGAGSGVALIALYIIYAGAVLAPRM